ACERVASFLGVAASDSLWRRRRKCVENVLYLLGAIRLSLFRSVRISRWLVFRQFGCRDFIGLKTDIWRMVVLDGSGGSVRLVTDFVVVFAKSFQCCIEYRLSTWLQINKVAVRFSDF